MYLYDTHVHTSEISPCGTRTAAQQVREAHKNGYAGLIITDHLVQNYANCPDNLDWEKRAAFQLISYQNAKKEGDALGMDVFFGWEYTHWQLIPGVDILTYGLDVDFLLAHPKLFTYGIVEYSSEVRAAGGYLAHAHPLRGGYIRGFDIPEFNPSLFDGVEVYNASEANSSNELALEYATKYNLLKQGGSDSHHKNDTLTGGVWLNERAKSIYDIIAAIKGGAKVSTRLER